MSLISLRYADITEKLAYQCFGDGYVIRRRISSNLYPSIHGVDFAHICLTHARIFETGSAFVEIPCCLASVDLASW